MNPRLIAFYLPQFHPCPENDQWWGRGFTEWTKVTRSEPQFTGHIQPRLPADLGFYDLRLPEAREAQAEMARAAGLSGFCYYYYWFNGRRLLHRPLDEVISSGRPDFPFCVCWANENWTRRWDGLESEILIAQQYEAVRPEDFLRDLLPILRDPRYIRVNGRPLLLVYRAEKIPQPERWVEVWRRVASEAGLGGLYLGAVQSFSTVDPTRFGFDAAVEFPPLGGVCDQARYSPSQTAVLCGKGSQFRGSLVDYRAVVRAALETPPPSYPRFRCVMPSWDNTPRRSSQAMVLFGGNPGAYHEWLAAVLRECLRTRVGEERIVFVNAWNEWAEGCHLEPDQYWGHAYLTATRAACLAATCHDPAATVAQGNAPLLFDLLESRERTIHALTTELATRDEYLLRLRTELDAAQRAAQAASAALRDSVLPAKSPGGKSRHLGTANRRPRALIFGASAGGARALQFLKETWDVVAFVDNAAVRQGTVWQELPVIGPGDLGHFADAAIFLASMYAAEIQQQLVGLGIARARLRHVDPRVLNGSITRDMEPAALLDVIIFGAGTGGQRALACLPPECRMLAFADNDPAKIGTTIAGFPVIHPVGLLSRAYDHVLVASVYVNEILEQLDQLGVPAHRVEVVHPDILLDAAGDAPRRRGRKGKHATGG